LIVSSIRATCPAYLNLLVFIIIIILDEECKSWCSSLFSFLRSPVASSLFGPYYPPQYPVLKHPQSMFFP
jgi:hypothetical protein